MKTVNFLKHCRGVSSEELNRGNEIIRFYYEDDFPNFEAIWMLKVTWRDMELFSDRTQVYLLCLFCH